MHGNRLLSLMVGDVQVQEQNRKQHFPWILRNEVLSVYYLLYPYTWKDMRLWHTEYKGNYLVVTAIVLFKVFCALSYSQLYVLVEIKVTKQIKVTQLTFWQTFHIQHGQCCLVWLITLQTCQQSFEPQQYWVASGFGFSLRSLKSRDVLHYRLHNGWYIMIIVLIVIRKCHTNVIR